MSISVEEAAIFVSKEKHLVLQEYTIVLQRELFDARSEIMRLTQHNREAAELIADLYRGSVGWAERADIWLKVDQ